MHYKKNTIALFAFMNWNIIFRQLLPQPILYMSVCNGPGSKYAGTYTAKQLSRWATRCGDWRKQGRDIYVYFDNDQLGYAAFNAYTLQKMVFQNCSAQANNFKKKKKVNM
jgi:uncharacterized protein YecE (DUF72 family)